MFQAGFERRKMVNKSMKVRMVRAHLTAEMILGRNDEGKEEIHCSFLHAQLYLLFADNPEKAG
jgi:hypothetical protein